LLAAIGAAEAQEVTRKKLEVLQRLSLEANRKNRDGTTSAKENDLREQFEELLRLIPFQDVLLLDRALTHRSYVYENPTQTQGDNEQLEFLGDIVLGFLAGTFVYQEHPGCKEGELTNRKSRLVENSQLAKFASHLDLGKWIKIGQGEEKQRGREKASLLSNTFEATIGAYYLDSGIEAVREVLEPLLQSIAGEEMSDHQTLSSINDSNPKGALQEYAQKRDFDIPKYSIVTESGADHLKNFTVEVSISGTVYGMGSGQSKKEAEKNAAIDALNQLKL
jgi:ribonuclease-3